MKAVGLHTYTPTHPQTRKHHPEEHKRGVSCAVACLREVDTTKNPLLRRRAEEGCVREPRKGPHMCFLPLIFPRRSEAGGGTVSYRKAAGGCQGVVGPDPSTLLNELNSTSFCHGEVSNSVTPSEFPFLLSSSFHHVFFSVKCRKVECLFRVSDFIDFRPCRPATVCQTRRRFVA